MLLHIDMECHGSCRVTCNPVREHLTSIAWDNVAHWLDEMAAAGFEGFRVVRGGDGLATIEYICGGALVRETASAATGRE